MEIISKVNLLNDTCAYYKKQPYQCSPYVRRSLENVVLFLFFRKMLQLGRSRILTVFYTFSALMVCRGNDGKAQRE